MAKYEKKYQQSIKNNIKFWDQQATSELLWDVPYHTTKVGTFKEGDLAWFLGGKLNASVQCIDRHIATNGDKIAIVWEADEPGNSKKYTYKQVLQEVCRIANCMKAHGVKKGDSVTIYMPMVPQIAFVMLACTRIGAPHSVVFAGFSAEALRDRIIDVESKFIFCCDEGLRGGKTIELKKVVDAAIEDKRCDFVEKVFMFHRTSKKVPFNNKVDVAIEKELENYRPFCPAESMDSEDILFFLYTSGSTGKPKGVAHTTAGYMLYATLTHKYVFDIRDNDVYACVADCGWITGHTYIVYGPLSNCATTLMFESTPLYPNPSRYWDLVQTHKVTQFYTAPTAIRALMRFGTDPLNGYDLSSLRVLGTVGEPINPEAWKWYYDNVGKQQCPIVDTYWQTETGGIIMTPLVSTPMKPGSCCKPFFGIDPVVLDSQTGKEIPYVKGKESHGVMAIRQPWPSLTRTVHGNHTRYMNTYLNPYPGYYFTGDGVTRDGDGFFWITGRVDDVINVSGHRLGSAEIESALVAHDSVAEAAVVGFPHNIKGEGIACFCILVKGVMETAELEKELKNQVRQQIGPFASPDMIVLTPGLPKTRSGKIMRRVLRKSAAGEADQLGDLSTLADSEVVKAVVAKVNEKLKQVKQ